MTSSWSFARDLKLKLTRRVDNMMKIYNFDSVRPEEIFNRDTEEMNLSIRQTVSDIINDVRLNGDSALFRLCEKFDKVKLSTLEVTDEEIDKAFDSISPSLLSTLKKAEKNIRLFHENQVKSGFIVTGENGIVAGQRILPIEKVGIYVPGGTAAYPSTVLMNAVPAKIAGCKQIIMVTPPQKDGSVSPAILAAAKLAGVDRIFKVGGAQAIAALAYGTQTIPQVYKITGPGNAFVAEAKRQVFGKVAIDMIAGPSEILVVADEKSNAHEIAADLLSQAEHDKMAAAVLVTNSMELARAVQTELEKQLSVLPREEIARESINNNGKIIVVNDLKKAIEVSNEIAPEHLELIMDNPFDYLDMVKNAGSVFLGRSCPEALGDYLSGANHTLPTSGTAKFYSPLSVDDFVKKSQYTYYTRTALGEVKDDIVRFARQEGLEAHARSVISRFEED